jgi:5-oxoprolinase (ATP-hydrolysing) subunit A
MASWWTTSVRADRRTIDLNADVGEADDDEGRAVERALLRLVTSVHIACGGHAGDEESMRAMVQGADESGVRVGAHPSYPDRAGFGRRPMEMAVGELVRSLTEQIGALRAVAASLGTEVRSVKPHGALYGDVARGGTVCDAFLNVVLATCGPGTWLVLPAGAHAIDVAESAGLSVLQEGFADRAYTADGELLARQIAGSVFSNPASAAAQALGLVAQGTVVAEDGTVLTLAVDTLGVHGDSPNALAMASAVRDTLDLHGIAVAAPSLPSGSPPR